LNLNKYNLLYHDAFARHGCSTFGHHSAYEFDQLKISYLRKIEPAGANDSLRFRLFVKTINERGILEKMIIALSDVWKQFENYAKTKGYNQKILGSYILSNEEGGKIKLISVRMRDSKLVVWEDNKGYYSMDLE
jgi:hypothetical protein